MPKKKAEVTKTPEAVSSKPEETKPEAPVKKKSTGLRSAVRLGEITAKEALRKLKKMEWVHPDTLHWFQQRVDKEKRAGATVSESKDAEST